MGLTFTKIGRGYEHLSQVTKPNHKQWHLFTTQDTSQVPTYRLSLCLSTQTYMRVNRAASPAFLRVEKCMITMNDTSVIIWLATTSGPTSFHTTAHKFATTQYSYFYHLDAYTWITGGISCLFARGKFATTLDIG